MTLTIGNNNIILPSGGTIYAGPIIQAKFARSNADQITVLSTAWADVISIEFTPKSPNSIIQVGGIIPSTSTFVYSTTAWIEDVTESLDRSLASNTETNNSKSDAVTTSYQGHTDDDFIQPESITTIHRNYGLSTRTYSLRHAYEWNGAYSHTGYIQNRVQNDMATPSYMYVWECDQAAPQRSTLNDGLIV